MRGRGLIAAGACALALGAEPSFSISLHRVPRRPALGTDHQPIQLLASDRHSNLHLKPFDRPESRRVPCKRRTRLEQPVKGAESSARPRPFGQAGHSFLFLYSSKHLSKGLPSL